MGVFGALFMCVRFEVSWCICMVWVLLVVEG
jgi:hypothetical protein